MTSIPKATHAGPLKIGNYTIDAVVLNDGTRVLSTRGIARAMGSRMQGTPKTSPGNGERQIPGFLSSKTLKPFITTDLLARLNSPIEYRPLQRGRTALGYEAVLLPKICEVILDADKAGALTDRQKRFVEVADMLMRGFATVGIIALVDEATGYQDVRARKALEEILDKFIAEKLREWAKTFPDEFYKEMFRLRGWPYRPWSHRRPSVIGHYTRDLVYERLAPGVIQELEARNPTIKPGYRRNKHFQWLTEDIGHPALKAHLVGVIALMKASANWREFKRLISRSMPRYDDNFELPLNDEWRGAPEDE